MCIAILKTKDGNITDEQLRNCFESNPDGAGISYSKNGKLYIIKGIFNVNEFIKAYHNAVAEADGAMLIHCRISTSGEIDKLNCHPHVVSDECVMIHNGILSITVPKDSKVSDTVLYVEQFLKPLPKDFMKDEGIINLITHDIGSGNKFVFLNNNGEYAIANEKAGHWKNGVWFSNYSYQGYTWGKITKGKNYSYSPCNSYWEDEYEWGDEDYFELTEEEEYQLKLVVADLTDEEVLKLGSSPVYDFHAQTLRRTKPVGSVSKVPVDEISVSVSNDLSDRYYEVLDNICYNGKDIEVTDSTLKLLIEEVTQEAIKENDFYYASELLEELMDDEYKNFVIDVQDNYADIVEEYPNLVFENYATQAEEDVEDDTIDVEVDYSSDRLQDNKSNDTKTLIKEVNRLIGSTTSPF